MNGNLVRWLALGLTALITIATSVVSCDRRFDSLEQRLSRIEAVMGIIEERTR